jgi:CheY-like chemotaxis protein
MLLPVIVAVMKPFVDPPGNTDILLVDDDAAICSLFGQVLSRAGYRVFTVDNAQSGLEILKRMAIPILITDLYMEKMDGLQLITRTRRNHPAVKIIAMTGGGFYEPDECLRLATDAGADEALSKPFQAKELLRAVGQLLPPPPLRDI